MIDRLISFAVALFLAFLVWLYARSRDQEVLDNVPVPVAIALTPGQAELYDLEINGPLQVPVSFRGPPSRIRELREILQRGELKVDVTLVVPEDRQGEDRYLDTVRVDASDVHGPPGVTPMVVEGRNRVPVTLRRLVERRLPVRLEPAPDEHISQVVVEPPSVLVRGPEDILDRVRSISTQPYVLPPASDGSLSQETVAAGPLSLVRELDGRPVRSTPGSVRVRLMLRPRQKAFELTDVPVQFLCPANFPLRPQFVDERAARITLKILAPATEESPSITAFIDLTTRKFESGLYADEPLRVQLPKDCQLAQPPPRSAAFQLISANDPLSKTKELGTRP